MSRAWYPQLIRRIMKPKADQIKRLETLESLEAENQKWCPTDSGRVRMDRLLEIAELRSILKQ